MQEFKAPLSRLGFRALLFAEEQTFLPEIAVHRDLAVMADNLNRRIRVRRNDAVPRLFIAHHVSDSRCSVFFVNAATQ